MNHKNFAETTLAAAITTTNGTSITVTSSTSFPSVPFIVAIDTEALLVTDVASETWTVTRGYESSTAATHLNGATIYHNISAAEVDGLAPIASPTFTSVPAAPTAAVDTNTTQLATTAFVLAQAASDHPVALGTAGEGASTRYARGDHVHPAATGAAIADEAVTYAKMQHVSATDKVLGRSTAGAGDVEEITCTAAGRALIDDANAAAQLTTLGAMPIAGGTVTGDITLSENTGLALDPSGSADEKWSGITIAGTAGVTIAVGDLCYLDVTAAEWLLADADAASTAGSVILGICLTAANDGGATRMLLNGTVRSAAFPASIALGAPVYISTTPGDLTATQPSGTDDVIRVVGWAVTVEPNTIYFDPSPDYITHV